MLFDDGQSEKVIEAAGGARGVSKDVHLGGAGLNSVGVHCIISKFNRISFRWVRFELPAHQGPGAGVERCANTALHTPLGLGPGSGLFSFCFFCFLVVISSPVE
jgi:hypothetical protein